MKSCLRTCLWQSAGWSCNPDISLWKHWCIAVFVQKIPAWDACLRPHPELFPRGLYTSPVSHLMAGWNRRSLAGDLLTATIVPISQESDVSLHWKVWVEAGIITEKWQITHHEEKKIYIYIPATRGSRRVSIVSIVSSVSALRHTSETENLRKSEVDFKNQKKGDRGDGAEPRWLDRIQTANRCWNGDDDDAHIILICFILLHFRLQINRFYSRDD